MTSVACGSRTRALPHPDPSAVRLADRGPRGHRDGQPGRTAGLQLRGDARPGAHHHLGVRRLPDHRRLPADGRRRHRLGLAQRTPARPPGGARGRCGVLGYVLYDTFNPFPPAPFNWVLLAAGVEHRSSASRMAWCPGVRTHLAASPLLRATRKAPVGAGCPGGRVTWNPCGASCVGRGDRALVVASASTVEPQAAGPRARSAATR